MGGNMNIPRTLAGSGRTGIGRPVARCAIRCVAHRVITTDPNNAALVEVILSVARHMHLSVVVEGVETAEQVAFLKQRGEVIHQGYLFSRPESA